MFSRTTIASSIRMPMASDNPSSDIVSRLNPSAHTAMKLASTEIGSATPVITVERAVHAADRRGEVLHLQRLHDLGDADVRRLQPLRIQLDRQLALDLAED